MFARGLAGHEDAGHTNEKAAHEREDGTNEDTTRVHMTYTHQFDRWTDRQDYWVPSNGRSVEMPLPGSGVMPSGDALAERYGHPRLEWLLKPPRRPAETSQSHP